MKKLLLAVLAGVYVLGVTAFADEKIKTEYSLMTAPLPENICHTGELTVTDEDFPVPFSARMSAEEIIYQSFDVLSPENIQTATVGKNENGTYYAEVPIPLYFLRDDTLGTPQEQFSNLLTAIHEVYARFLADNPEYFYLIPRNYGGSGVVSESYIQVTFEPVICFDFPDFDGTQEALAGLKTKYDNLITAINTVAEDLMFDGMTDLDKLLLAHDYIINNSAYYLEIKENGTKYYGNGYSYNAYGIFMNKKGVCQGLSYAYPALLKAMGYPTENIRQIRSGELQHMWNFVKLGESWYHIDLTWDDPVVISNGVYDMNNEASQYEFHDCFLMSDEKNTRIRNSKGYSNFTLDILGYDDNPHTLADDTSYESGYIFNDLSNGSATVSGRVEYEDGFYKKYYENESLYFNFDSLRAMDYAVSQPVVKTDGDIVVVVLGSNKKTVSNVPVSFYTCCYDQYGRFLKTQKQDKDLTQFGEYPISINVVLGTKQVKILTLKGGTVIPVANVPVIK